jgi:4'-phosphopantetheinyl transferase
LENYYLYCGDINLKTDNRSPDRSEGVINIWTIDIDSLLPGLAGLKQLLNKEEVARAARFHQEKDAQQFIITRAVLRILLADALALDPKEIDIISAQNKKPFLAKYNEVHFNVSHSANRAVIAIAKQAVGIDVEFLKTGFEYQSIVEYAFSETEAVHLQKSNHPYLEFFRLWTRKEAFLKGLGKGLINDLKLISCIGASNEIPAVIGTVACDWEVSTLVLGPAYIMSIAFERAFSSKQVNLFNFPHAVV